jgi:signal transduction histidine kinase/DNA-binding response OmpR family regulator
MASKQSALQDKQALIRQYVQVLLVVAAFALMVVFSYLFVRDLELKQLRENVKNAISYTELNIRSGLLEPETLLASISETIRLMILDGYGSPVVRGYMQNINNYVQSDPQKRIIGVMGIYGVFDVFGDEYIFISNDAAIAPPDTEPKNRSWYLGAIEKGGEIYISDPVIDTETGIVFLTLSRVIYDEYVDHLGVVCIGIQLTRITEYAINTKFAESGFGFLLDGSRRVFAHVEPSMLGTPGLVVFEEELLQHGYLSERLVTNFRGVKSILFIQRLYNGWYMGVVTPVHEYYHSVRDMLLILSVLGVIFAAVLSVILGNLSAINNRLAAKNRSIAHWYKSILDAVSSPITVTNKDMEWTFINKTVEDFLKVNRDDVVGRKCSGWNANICNTENCGIIRLRAGYSETYFEQFGGKFHVDVSYLYDENGEMIGHVEVVKDITDIVDMTKKQAEAESANRAKSDFLAKVSHEIRTPLNAILGITEIQMQKDKLDSDMQEALDKIYNSGYLLLNIINDILDLSKIEAGKLDLVPVNYDVASLINDSIYLNVMRYDSKPIVFHVNAEEDVPLTLLGDDLRIKQVLNNLLSNAFKYTDRGEITLAISVNTIDAPEGKTNLVFCVSDTGQGMNSGQVDNLFNEYTRFNLDANRTTEGTGLGMAITKHLVQKMGGTINVKSEIGKGSVFTVSLPQGLVDEGVFGKELAENLSQFHLDTPQQMKKMPQVSRDYMPYGRVLIVDDVETNLYVARGLMAPYGLSVETVPSGYEALDKLKGGSTYDVIFMDHFMPNMDGMETTKIIRSLGYSHPIIALTANALAGQMEMFLANGFDGFISKPIDIRQLDATLIKFIRDKYPEETVLAAQRLKAGLKTRSREKGETGPDPKLAEVFVRDAQKAIAVLETILINNFRRTEDVSMFIVNVHAMKSALANIGEKELSDMAFTLEKAGRENAQNDIMEKIHVFLEELHNIVERVKPKENEKSTMLLSTADMDYLHEKLLMIQGACSRYDKKTAKEEIAALKEKPWPHEVMEQLGAISEKLLHSDFEEAAQIVAEMV